METTTTLAGTEVNKDALYLVDWNKLDGVESLVLIFACMGLSFSGTHPQFEMIKHLLDLSNPINVNKMPHEQEFHPAEKIDLKLPKLKSL